MKVEELREEVDRVFDGDFMEPQVEFGDWYEVQEEHNSCETWIIPQEYYEEQWIIRNEYNGMFGARFSAPGYLDCTDWTIHETEEEALEELLSNAE